MAQIGRKILRFQLFVWLLHALMAERERWPLWLPVLLGCGIGLYFSLAFEPPLWWGGAGFVFFASVALVVRQKSTARAMAALAIGFVFLGLTLAGVRTWWVAAPVIAFETGPVSIEGQVTRVEKRPKGLRVTLGHLNIQRLSPAATPQRVRVTLTPNQPDFAPGDRVNQCANVISPPAPAGPGAFDFQRQSYFRRLGGVGFSFGKAEITGREPEQSVDSLPFALERLRLSISQRVRAALDGSTGAVAAALMTGDRGAIPEQVLDNMRASGLAHLLAISGLHVGLITGIVFFSVRATLAMIRPLALRYPIKKWAALVSIGAAGGYALLAGATVPTQRAFLMIFLVLLAVLLDRRALSMRTVAWAAMAILVVAPESLLGASFQLSFAAVVALISVYEALRSSRFMQNRGGGWMRGVGRYVLGVAITTLVAGLATALFAAFHFNRVADFSLAANLGAVPLTALWIMPWAATAYALMPFGLERLALTPMGWGVDGVLAVADTVAHWPGAVSHVKAFPLWGLALVSLGGLWLAIWRNRWRLLGVPLALAGMLAFSFTGSPDVLVDRTGKLAAVKTDQGGYVVSTLRAKRFDSGVWLRRAGLTEVTGRWPLTGREGADVQDGLRCDTLGCILTVPPSQGRARTTVAFAFSPEAQAEDCTGVDVLVALKRVSDALGCAANVFIPLNKLKSDGAHALYFTKVGIRVETVRALRGDRPWVVGQGFDEKVREGVPDRAP